jgi:hypothetical protein
MVAEMARITRPDIERLDYLLPEEFKFGLMGSGTLSNRRSNDVGLERQRWLW